MFLQNLPGIAAVHSLIIQRSTRHNTRENATASIRAALHSLQAHGASTRLPQFQALCAALDTQVGLK